MMLDMSAYFPCTILILYCIENVLFFLLYLIKKKSFFLHVKFMGGPYTSDLKRLSTRFLVIIHLNCFTHVYLKKCVFFILRPNK